MIVNNRFWPSHCIYNSWHHTCIPVTCFWSADLSVAPLPPLGPHLRCDVGLEEREYKENCLCLAVLCTIVMVHKGRAVLTSSRLYQALVLLGLALLSSEHLCVFGLHGATYIIKKFCLHPSLYLLVSLAWWDWPLTWLTNHCSSVLWHCWLGHLTREIVSKMIYNVSSGTLNTTVPYNLSVFGINTSSASAVPPLS